MSCVPFMAAVMPVTVMVMTVAVIPVIVAAITPVTVLAVIPVMVAVMPAVLVMALVVAMAMPAMAGMHMLWPVMLAMDMVVSVTITGDTQAHCGTKGTANQGTIAVINLVAYRGANHGAQHRTRHLVIVVSGESRRTGRQGQCERPACDQLLHVMLLCYLTFHMRFACFGVSVHPGA